MDKTKYPTAFQKESGMNQITRYASLCLSVCTITAVAFAAMLPATNDKVLQLRGGGWCCSDMILDLNCGPAVQGGSCIQTVNKCSHHDPEQHGCAVGSTGTQHCPANHASCANMVGETCAGSCPHHNGDDGGLTLDPTIDPQEIDP